MEPKPHRLNSMGSGSLSRGYWRYRRGAADAASYSYHHQWLQSTNFCIQSRIEAAGSAG